MSFRRVPPSLHCNGSEQLINEKRDTHTGDDHEEQDDNLEDTEALR